MLRKIVCLLFVVIFSVCFMSCDNKDDAKEVKNEAKKKVVNTDNKQKDVAEKVLELTEFPDEFLSSSGQIIENKKLDIEVYLRTISPMITDEYLKNSMEGRVVVLDENVAAKIASIIFSMIPKNEITSNMKLKKLSYDKDEKLWIASYAENGYCVKIAFKESDCEIIRIWICEEALSNEDVIVEKGKFASIIPDKSSPFVYSKNIMINTSVAVEFAETAFAALYPQNDSYIVNAISYYLYDDHWSINLSRHDPNNPICGGGVLIVIDKQNGKILCIAPTE